jgi:hypothetical protein
MKEYFKIIECTNKISNNPSNTFNSSNLGEYEIYNKNISQKKSNDLTLNINHDSQIKFTNFGYSPNGNYLACICKDKDNQLIIYDTLNKEIRLTVPIPQELKLILKEFIHEEKRGFIKKVFSKLSFLQLNQNTNTIFINNTGSIVTISSCKCVNI